MRIISGIFKGKKLIIPKDKHTRPLKDNVKESIFNILEHSNLINYKINNSNVLDLFSGVGSFGLECISRKSKHVTFLKTISSLKMLKKNIQNLNCSKKTKIIEKIFFVLEKLKINLKNYEFIFLDPPFKERKIKLLLEIIKKKKFLKKNGSIILIHRDKKILDEFPEDFKIIIK